MKKNIHPEYKTIQVTCITCSNKHEIGTTAKEISVDTCSKCHAFYVGKGGATKSTGRVERFNRMFGDKNKK
ncbi:MAG: 50S ribosomal protein L31 [Mycoplasma sp.]|nr:50S ribosomal protein L31 [Mycoplasma sp.]